MKHKLNSIAPAGSGCYKISILFRNKVYNCITSNMPSVDDYNSEPDEKDGRELCVKRGYNALRNEIIRKNELNYVRNKR